MKKPYDCNFSKESSELAKEVVSLLIRSSESYETCERALEAAGMLLENLTRPILIENVAQQDTDTYEINGPTFAPDIPISEIVANVNTIEKGGPNHEQTFFL